MLANSPGLLTTVNKILFMIRDCLKCYLIQHLQFQLNVYLHNRVSRSVSFRSSSFHIFWLKSGGYVNVSLLTLPCMISFAGLCATDRNNLPLTLNSQNKAENDLMQHIK